MNTKEALIALANGKKIRKLYWNKGEYIHLVEDIIRFYDGKEYINPSQSFDSTYKWEEYVEKLSFDEVKIGNKYRMYDTENPFDVIFKSNYLLIARYNDGSECAFYRDGGYSLENQGKDFVKI